jgi:hypothetical protein
MTAEEIFERLFRPLYPKGADLSVLRSTDANTARNPHLFAQLDHAAEVFAKLAPEALDAPDLALDFSDASVHRLASKLTREARDALTAQEAVGDAPSTLVGSRRSPLPSMLATLVTHGALYVGACVVRNHGATWQLRNPMWESLVRLDSKAGTGDLAIFQWWLKALSDEEIDHARLADRYRTHVEVPTFDASSLPVICPVDRRIPRLAKVKYDTLHKHLRAHVPELRDVGEDFPSPERFVEMGFKWLEILPIGGGRMLLMHGPTDRGVHVMWLDAKGFNKAAYYPADAFPEHKVKVDGDKLTVIVSVQGTVAAHEMLWWGA